MKTSASLFLTDILPAKRNLYSRFVKNKVIGKASLERVFESLQHSGVEGIELLLPSYAKVTYQDIEEVKMILDAHKMPVLSVHQKLRFFTRTRVAEITKLFHSADILNAKVIVLHMNSAGKQVFDKEYITTIHSLQKKYNITVGFENRERHLHSVVNKHGWHEEVFPLLMKDTDFSITLDTTHLAQSGGDILRFFKNHKDRIVNIHLSDYKKHFLNPVRPMHNKHLPLGKGDLPIKEFLQMLRNENYKGLITMEIHTDLSGMCESAEIIRRIKESAN